MIIRQATEQVGYPRSECARDSIIDLLKWIAILGVVWVHVPLENADFLWRLPSKLLGWVVLAFFGCAGYLARDKRGELLSNIARRAQRLLVPYLTVSVIAFLGLLLLQYFGLYEPTNETYILTLDNLVFRLMSGAGFGPHFYFLPYLFWIGSLASFLLRKFTFNSVFFLSGCALLLQSIGPLPPQGALGSGPDKWLLYFFAYVMGMFWAKVRAGQIPLSRIYLLVTCVFLAGCIYYFSSGKYIYFQLLVPVVIYWLLHSLRIAGWLKQALASGQGAVFCWHAPVILVLAEHASAGVGKHYPPFCYLFMLVGAFGVGECIRRAGLSKWLSL